MKTLAGFAFAMALAASASAAPEITLVDQGKSRVCVVVPEAALTVDPARADANQDLVHSRWAGEDLTNYLAQISGATVPLGPKPAAGLVPIYVGTAPEKLPMTARSEYGDAYLIDATPQRIVLQGESSRAVYYAAAMLLHQLGVRWYAPTELGECVPRRGTIALAAGRTESAPKFQTRNLWSEKRWGLRNRMSGPMMAQGHGFGGLINSAKVFPEHPEYYPVVNGKPVPQQVNLASDAVADLFAKAIAEQFRKGTPWAGGNGACIGPDDGMLMDERPEVRALQTGELDPFLQYPSMTDPFVNLGNKVAKRLEGEFPNHYLGFYVYSNHNLPPTRYEPHRMLFPIITPITYTRFGSIGNPNVPTSMFLVDVIKGWRPKVARMGSYLYNFNLADGAMPFSRTLYFRKSIPKLYELGVHHSTVESFQDNWQHSVPGGYVYSHVAWDTAADVDALLAEFYETFYGPAAAPMRRYNAVIEDAYETTGAYAGNIWSMHRIFPADKVKALADSIAQATKLARGQAPFEQRVEIAGTGLKFLESWLAARAALNEGKLAEAARFSDQFSNTWAVAHAKYPTFVGGLAWGYYAHAHHPAFTDAGRIARDGNVFYRFPDAWKGRLDKEKLGIKDAWFTPTADASGWGTFRTHGVSLDEQGYPFYRGLIWYRQEFALPKAARKAGAVRLWIGGVDDAARVYLNGTLLGTFAGKYFAPVDVDLTPALKRDGPNVLVVAVDNSGINELGTGGIMRPVLLYEPKVKPVEPDKGKEKKGAEPLFGG